VTPFILKFPVEKSAYGQLKLGVDYVP